MSQISYLFLASKKKDSPEHIEISVEIIFDVIESPRWNFYGFKRSGAGVISTNGRPGVVDTIVLENDEKERSLIKNLFSTKEINDDLKKIIQDKVYFFHEKTLRGISDIEILLKQICRWVNFLGVGHKKPCTAIQVCIETIGELTSDFLLPRQLHEEVTNDHRAYSGGKYLSLFGSLTDVGRIEAPAKEIDEIESRFLVEILKKHPLQTLQNLIEKHYEFAKYNRNLIMHSLPNPSDAKASKDYIEVLMEKNFILCLLDDENFSSFLNDLEVESKKSLEIGMDADENSCAYYTLKHIQKILQKDLFIEKIIFNRLRSEENPDIQAECIKKIATSLSFHNEKRKLIEYSSDLICKSSAVREMLSNSDMLLVFLQYAFLTSSQNFERLDIVEQLENSSEFIKFSTQIDRFKGGDEPKLILKIPKLIERGEYNKSLFLLNACFPHLVLSDFALDLADLYVACLLATDGERTARIIESSEVLLQRLNTLSLMVDYVLKEGDHRRALKFLDRMKMIEPNCELTENSTQKIKRAKFIESIESRDITPESLQELSGIEFEALIKKRFVEMGFLATETPVTGDYGADLIIEDKNETRYIVQCKRFSKKVNLKAVQEVVGALNHYSGDYGIVMTNNQFLPSAIKLAESNGIELWDGDKLLSFFAGDIEFSVISESEV